MMKISKILGLTSPCPHCDAQISRAKTFKNLSFCPVCGGSLLYVKKSNVSRFGRQDVFWWLAGSLLLATWHSAAQRDWLIMQHAEKYIFIGLAVLCACLVWELLSSAKSKRWRAGVDDLVKVNSDLCPEYGTASTLPLLGLSGCPCCQSQRLASRYWYKRNIAQGDQNNIEKLINQINESCFVGCLACGNYYEFQKQDSDRNQYRVLRDAMGWIVLVTCLLVAAMWLFEIGKQHPSDFFIEYFYFWLSSACWFAMMIFPKRLFDRTPDESQRANFLRLLTPANDHHLSR